MREFKKVLIANRGEIAIRVMRAVQELGMRAVAVYCEEDKYSLFKSKADEAYMIRSGSSPSDAYLNIDEIIEVAISRNVDAIHPGYGFLSENPDFARECERHGIKFIGPSADVIDLFGSKINAKEAARQAGVQVVPGKKVSSIEEAVRVSEEIGFPVMIKASAGGGGRGMRLCRDKEKMPQSFDSAVREAVKAFGNGEMFIEKYIEHPRHVEVQILADEHGNVVHLYERDCSIQRRHQKIVEFSPCLSIDEQTRQRICADAVKLAKHVGYTNAGTVEFLLDAEGNHYFIEVNPRVQVEHTITELVCGVDIVQSQILIAEGYTLDSKEINIKGQEDVVCRGAAIECRITTENVANNFMPDSGKIEVYKTGSGPGIRLDGGNGFTGAVISPYFDSLLFKTTAYDRDFAKATRKMLRVLKEHVIEGVKTNKDFLINVLEHEDFKNGRCTTSFIEDHPELLNVNIFDDREYKVLKYIGERTIEKLEMPNRDFENPASPNVLSLETKKGTKQILDQQGPDGLVKWIQQQDKLLISDTTMRDAHQSLFATRMRTIDMVKIAKATSRLEGDVFSLEMWGGATFDVAYRFLKESPWTRLRMLRERIPNLLFQMLLRGSNAVGYKNYPDNVIREFIKQSADSGIDVFRIFDSLNWMEQIKPSVEEVLRCGKVAEVAICYTGDILDKTRTKYTLEYYVKKAKEAEAMGAHILAIKDMAGLLKPAAAYELTKALKEELSIPVHMHTHDTSGNGVSSMYMASLAGADIVDGAIPSMSGITSQPSIAAIVAATENTPRATGLDLLALQKLSDYYEKVRMIYASMESGLKTSTAMAYKYEVPGGQYSNLKAQADSFGIGHRFSQVLEKYKLANDLLGDIVKVTPSSKVVGDLAIFMVQNDLDAQNIYTKGAALAFPDSVVDFFKGNIGQPEGGFNERLREVVLKGAPYISVRPGTLLPDENFDEIRAYYKKKYDITLSKRAVLSAALYPKVYEEYIKFLREYGDYIYLDSDVFFYGLVPGKETSLRVSHGKNKIIRLISMSDVDSEGRRLFVYEVDGFRREVHIEDTKSVISQIKSETLMAQEDNDSHVASSIPGNVVKIFVKLGQEVKENEVLAVVEAMKMETEIVAPKAGKVTHICVDEGVAVKKGQLLMEIE